MKYDTWKIGQSVRNLRKKHLWSIEDFSRKLGVSPSHLTQIELGYRNVGIELLYKMMGIFETDANTVLDVTDKYENHDNISIDALLEQLPEDKKLYFQKVFLYMLCRLPAEK